MVTTKADLLFALDMINQCLQAGSTADIARIFELLSSYIGISGGLIGRNDSFISGDLLESTMNTFGIAEEWKQLYMDNDLVNVDPIVKSAFLNQTPVRWADVYKSPSPDQSRFINIAREFKLFDGLTNGVIADRKNGVATIVSAVFSDAMPSRKQLIILQDILPHLNEAIAYPTMWSLPKLTPKELEVLKWAKAGKSYWETGYIMSISESTVKFHLGNVYKKLNVVNRSQAIARAIRLGYVDL